MSSPLLTIAVPTYNRPMELAGLYQGVFAPLLAEFADLVELLVCDNSDQEIANRNAKVFGAEVRYLQNGKNLGFAGNILKCVREAQGEFLWMISDNDNVLAEGVVKLVHLLRDVQMGGIDCVMLPYLMALPSGDIRVDNGPDEWGVETKTDLESLLRKGKGLPFILFSSVVLRLERVRRQRALEVVETQFAANDFIQIPLFLAMLEKHSQIRFADFKAQQYRPEYHSRFKFTNLARSMDEVVRFAGRYGAPTDFLLRRFYRGWLIWGIHDRLGPYEILDAPLFVPFLLRALPRNLNLKNILLGIALCLPKWLVRWPYLFWQGASLARSVGDNTVRGAVGRALILHGRVKDRLAERI